MNTDTMRSLLTEARKHHLQETLDKPYRWYWSTKPIRKKPYRKGDGSVGFKTVRSGHAIAQFKTDNGTHYMVDFSSTHAPGDQTYTTVDFSDNSGNIHVTGKEGMDSLRVFATVIHITRKFIDIVRPVSIQVSALKERGGGTSRQSLYKRFVNRFASELGYEIRNIRHHGSEMVITLRDARAKAGAA